MCDRRSNLTNTTLAEPPLLAARTYAGGLRWARLLTSLSFSCRRAPCRGRGEGVCSVLARVANPATTLVCRHRVAQIGPEMPTLLLRFPLGWLLPLSAKTFTPRSKQPAGAFNEVTAWPSAHVSADCQSGHRSQERFPPSHPYLPPLSCRGVPLAVGWCLVMPTSNSNRTYCYGLPDALPSSPPLSWLAFFLACRFPSGLLAFAFLFWQVIALSPETSGWTCCATLPLKRLEPLPLLGRVRTWEPRALLPFGGVEPAKTQCWPLHSLPSFPLGCIRPNAAWWGLVLQLTYPFR